MAHQDQTVLRLSGDKLLPELVSAGYIWPVSPSACADTLSVSTVFLKGF